MAEPTTPPTVPTIFACSLAEVLGTFLLVFFGCGAVHVAVLTGELSGLWQVAVTWGVAIMVAIYTVGAISGAHINPAITIGQAVWGLFPWRRVLPYILAQLVGAFLAAAVLFVLFQPFLSQKEQQKHVERGQPGSEITAMCYGEYFPNPGPLGGGTDPYNKSKHESHNELVSEPVACLAEILGTAILGLVVLAVTDDRNRSGPGKLAPVFIGLTVSILIVVIAPLTQACFNPARDFGPRLFAWLAGWGPIALPGPRGAGFFNVYIASPIVGSILGMALYRLVLRPQIPGTSLAEV
jgi:glycerol uptake facilitator protein